MNERGRERASSEEMGKWDPGGGGRRDRDIATATATTVCILLVSSTN